MINSLTIQNFQSYKNTSLTFVNGVNAITGSSDTGKTAIFRALNWLVNNSPSGDDFKSNWGGDTIVILRTDSEIGDNISRLKSDKENLYCLTSLLKEPINHTDFKAFGQGVPKEIQEILNISSVNLQDQHSRHFLISNTSGEVARYINEIADLDIIDRALSHVARKVKDSKQKLGSDETMLDRLSKEISAFDWIGNAEEKLFELEELEIEINEAEIKSHAFINLIASMQKANDKIKKISRITSFESNVDKLLQIQIEIEDLQCKKRNLSRAIEKIKSKDKETLNANNKIIKLEKGFI